MKRAISILAQFLLFYVVFFLGTLWHPFHVKWFVRQLSPTSTRDFTPDGLILVCVVYVLMLALAAARKGRSTAAFATTLAFAFALALGLLSKFGWATHDLY